jgi:hypothetical protein
VLAAVMGPVDIEHVVALPAKILHHPPARLPAPPGHDDLHRRRCRRRGHEFVCYIEFLPPKGGAPPEAGRGIPAKERGARS